MDIAHGRRKEKTVSAVCKGNDADAQFMAADGKGVCDGRYHLLRRSGHSELLYERAWHGQTDGGKLVFSHSCTAQRDSDRIQHIPADHKVGRRRGACADYRICQFRSGAGDRVQKGRTGIRYRLQDFYDRRASHSVWNFYKLAAWTNILDRKNGRSGVNRSFFVSEIKSSRFSVKIFIKITANLKLNV